MLQLFTIYFCFILIVNSCKYYNYLQSILKQNFFTKVIKMPCRNAWTERSKVVLKEGVECKRYNEVAE